MLKTTVDTQSRIYCRDPFVLVHKTSGYVETIVITIFNHNLAFACFSSVVQL